MSLTKKTILFDFCVLGALAAFLIERTWQKWAHPIWDFGREVYIPWRLTQGEVLYKDLTYMFGAFPPLWNATLFKVFGPSFLTISLFNILLSLISTALIYRLFLRLGDRMTALLSAICFLCLFTFNLFKAHNAYYITPYTHSCLYALFFGICSMNILHLYVHNPKKRLLFTLGLFLGLMLLSRLEIFLALFFPLMIILSVFVKRTVTNKLGLFNALGTLLLGMTLPFITILLNFLPHFSMGDASTAIVGYHPKWIEISQMQLYKNLAGFGMWQHNARTISIALSFYLILLIGLHAAGHCLRYSRHKNTMILRITSVLLLTIALCFAIQKLGVEHISGIFSGHVILIIALAIHYFRKLSVSKNSSEWPDACVVLTLCSWAFLLLLKVPLQASPMSYGYFYAFAGVLTSVFFILFVLPKHFEVKYGTGRYSQMLLVAVLLCVCTISQLQSLDFLTRKKYAVGQGPNRTLTFDMPLLFRFGSDTERFLQWAQTHLQPDDTFVTFPQGVTLNFLTKHLISGRHVTYMPAELTAYDERSMLIELMADPPDYFVFINHDTSVYGNMVLGQNYAINLFSWVITHYSPVWQTGTEFGQPGFGIKVLKHAPIRP